MAQTNWQRAEESPDLLLRAGKALADGESVLALHGLDPAIRSYVQRSRARVNRRVLVRRLAVASLAALSIIAAATSYIANQQREVAEHNLTLADRATGFVIGLFDTTRPNSGAESLTAREMLDEGVRRIPVEFADDPLNRSRLLHATGNLYLQMGEMDRAQELLTLALQESRESTRERYEYAWSLAELHVVRNHQIADAEADRLLRLAIESLERSGAEESEVASAYWRAASLAQPEWRYSPYYWEQTYQRYTSPTLAKDPNAPGMLAQFAVVLAYERREPVNLRDADRALALFRQSLEMFEEQNRSADKQYLETLENAAVVEYSTGSSLQAIEFQRRAAEGSLDVLGRLHIATPFRWQTLGDYLLIEGFYAKAESALREAASMYLDSYGAETPKWFETSLSLAEAWFNSGRFEEAGQLVNALEAKQEHIWKTIDHPKTWRLWHQRGHLARSAGDMPEAASAYRTALERISRIAADGNVVRERIRVELDALFAEASRDYSEFTRDYLDKEASWPESTGNSFRREALRPDAEMLLALVRLSCDGPYGGKAGEILRDRIQKSWQNETWYPPAADNALAACGYIDLSERELQANAKRVSELTHPATYMAIEAARSASGFPTLASGSDSP
jgi:tetratricopeptide (TPR) repeat protein